MAFNTAEGRAEYTASGGQVLFTFTFKIYTTADILVYLTPAGQIYDDVADLLTLTTDYTVVINGDNGGDMTLVSGATAGDRITIVRDLAIDRTTDYQTGGDLDANTLDNDQDYQTYLVGDRKLQIDRCLQLPKSVQGASTTLPSPVSLNVMRWNAAANALENVPIAASDVFVNILNVDTMSDLIGVTNTDSETINVRGYHSINDGGGGIFNWDSTINKNTANAGTIIDPSVSLALQGTGVGFGCWVRQYSGAINVKWFGAKGDGTTDDTSALQLAIDLGLDTFIPNGTYKITAKLVISTPFTKLFGEKGSVIYYFPPATDPAIEVTVDDVTIDGLYIDCNTFVFKPFVTDYRDYSAIVLQNNVDRTKITNNFIVNTGLNGIVGYGNHNNLLIRNNTINDVGFIAICPSIDSGRPATSCIFDGNMMNNMGQDGIGTVAMQNCTISNNTIKNHTIAGISLEANCHYTTVVGNTIIGNGTTSGQGVQVNDSIGVSVIGNTMYTCGAGVLAGGSTTSFSITITGNVIIDSGYLQDSCILVGSTATNSFLSSHEYGAVVTGNTIRNAATTAIFINAVNGVIVEGNTIKNWNTEANTTSSRYMGAIVLRNYASFTNISNNTIAEDTPAWYRVGIIEVGDSSRPPAANIIENNRITGVDQDALTQYHGTYQSRVIRFGRGTAAPTTFSWLRGQEFLHSFPAAGGYYGWMSTDADGGSFSSNFTSTTANTTVGSAVITNAATTDGLFEGMSISVAGAFTSAVIAVIDRAAGSITVNKTASATTSGAALTLYAPTFKQFGAILP